MADGPPTYRSPEAIRLRDAMDPYVPVTVLDAAGQQRKEERLRGQRSMARKLIDLVLGGGDQGASDYYPETSDKKPPSDLVQNMLSFIMSQYPQARSGVGSLFRYEPRGPKDDILGLYVEPFGNLGIRETDPETGQPLSQAKLKEIILHELSHARGTNDVSGSPREVGAYDITHAAQLLAPRDVNLPLEKELLARELEKHRVKR